MKKIYKSFNYIIYDDNGDITVVSTRDSRYSINSNGFYVYDTTAEARVAFYVPIADIGTFLTTESGSVYWTESTFTEFLNENTSNASTSLKVDNDDVSIINPVPVLNIPSTIGNFGVDASGRQRVGQLTTLFDGKTLGSDDTEIFSNVGTGTGAWANNMYNMSVTSGQYQIRQTKRWFPYFSGKSQLIEVTFDNFETEAGVIKRVGYFSSSAVAPYTANFDGFWIEDDGTKKVLKIYNNGTEKVSVDFTAMDNYAIASSYDFSNFTVMAFDFLWLGGAILRVWLKTDLGFILLHTVNYSGTDTSTFTLSPNQPLRYEVRGTSAAGSMRYICAQIATEGSLNEAGKTKAIYNDSNITTNSTSTTYALLGLRKLTSFRDVAVQIIEIGVVNTSQNDSGMILLLKNPTLSAVLSYSTNGKLESALATNQTVSADGYVIAAAPAGLQGSSSVMKENFLSFLGNDIVNVMDQYVLAYRPASSNQSVRGLVNIKEF